MAAARLGMNVGTVYQAKSNVARLLREEIRKLEGENPPAQTHCGT